ncbi:MAG: PIN domain-containing protein [Patescibacteria group bacterium]
MKNKFKEFYRYKDNEIEKIWKECIFVFDTNILLDLYRYSKSTSDKFIKILKKITQEERLWLPHQVGLEFNKKRIILISDLKKSYSDIKETIENSFNDAQKKIDDKYHKEHPFINLKEIESEIEKCKKIISKTIETNEKSHPDWFNKDEIFEAITEIFENKVGDEYKKEELSKIFEEGKERYANKIPPGYEDLKNKEDGREYGDLILWFQIIDMAKSSKKSIVFITRDNKSDWWWKQSGDTIGPRHELKYEINKKAGVDFHMYSSEKFLEYASDYYKETVDQKSIKEVKRMSRLLEEKNYIMHKMMNLKWFKTPFVHEFIMQQEMLNKELANLVRETHIDEEILFEFSRNQERVMHFIEHISNEERPHPMMFEELSMLKEKMQIGLLDFMKSREMDERQKEYLMRFLERMNESYMMLIRCADKEGVFEKYYHRNKINNHRLQRYLRDDVELES